MKNTQCSSADDNNFFASPDPQTPIHLSILHEIDIALCLSVPKGSMVEAGTIRALSKVMEVGAVESVLPLVAAALRCLTQVASPTETPAKDKDKEKDGVGGAPSGDGDDGAGARYNDVVASS